MKILYKTEFEKWPLPKGKLNVRWRQMRACYQCFAGNTYIDCASGDTAEIAIEELKRLYVVPEDAEIKIH